MGEDAGAASVEVYIYSKHEKLFDKAILQSGCIAAPWAIVNSNDTLPVILARKLGFGTDYINEALSILSNTDTNLVIGALNDLSIRYRACVEKKIKNIE